MNKTFVALCLSLLWLGPSPAQSVTPASILPEGPSGLNAQTDWVGRRFAVAAANPLAVQAGYQILQVGGSAVDAAIAVQMVLTLVEPQSSGIGGGAFLLHFNGKDVQAFDGRETAPASVSETLFLGADAKPLRRRQAIPGGRAVGTPGTVVMLEMAHRQHGKLPWAQLFDSAITLARKGFAISPRLNTLLASDKALRADPVAAKYFYDLSGQPWPVGHVLKNPELAEVLSQISARGSSALMQGDVAQAMVKLVQSHPVNPGQLSLTDLSGYRAIERAPLCHDYSAPSAFKSADASGQKLYRICGMPPPSSGAIAMGQILGLLQNTPAATLQPGLSAEWLHLYTEATRLALADRAVYLGDPDFVQAPSGNWMSLLAPTYLAARARQITERAMDLSTVRAGQPGGQPSEYAPMPNQLEYGTSHISIIDGNGNALAMTTTIEDAFGARLMVNRGRGLSGGFLLNNELTDFSFVPRDTSGRLIANRVQPGKRPRSSMSPTLVFDKASGKLVLSVGSPGGAFIINFVAKTLYASLNWNMTPQQAIALPNFGILEGTPLILEVQLVSASIREALKAKGHEILEVPLPSGLQGLALTADGLIGGADPRREGTVMGD